MLPLHARTRQKRNVRCNVVAEDNWSILSDFGLAPADIPEAVWEVIPFSFLVDYVVNIGEYLAALKATAYQKIYAWSTTVELENLTERTLSSYTVDPPWAMVVPSTGYDSLLVKSKYRNHGSFGASLAYRPLQVALSPVHIQNILSLTVQSLSGISRGGRAPFK
nr:MAG: maturation protein [Sanya solspi-like virus 2]